MKKEPVRCWALSLPNYLGQAEDGHWITFPEDNAGHDLITCINCGHLYAVNVARSVYLGPPLAEKLGSLKCVQCEKPLDAFGKKYPEVYRDNTGHVLALARPVVFPPDEESVIRQLDQIY